MTHVLLKLLSPERAEKDNSDIPKLLIEAPHEDGADPEQSTSQVDRCWNFIQRRRLGPCNVRSADGHLPCLRQDCPARFKKKGMSYNLCA